MVYLFLVLIAASAASATYNSAVKWVWSDFNDYTCADVCAKLSGYDDSCDSSAYDVTRADILTKIYPQALGLSSCSCDFTGGLCDGELAGLSNNCDLLSFYLSVESLTINDNGDDATYLTVDDDEADDGESYPANIVWNTDSSCYNRGGRDDTDGNPFGGDRGGVFCPCTFEATSTPTESPTKKPTTIPNIAPTARPTVNRPSKELEKKFAKIEKQLDKEISKLRGN